nr:tripartite tricarboxylate transporter substrate-binding protein [Patulibacter sp. SYSU D01012]
MAPADPGGGWDSTARALQSTIREAFPDGPGADVYNVTGAGGTLGLSQLVTKNDGDPYQLMVMGLVMMGAIETNRSAATLDDVTPIATLTTETEAIVVPASSPIRTLDDLVARLKRDPGSIRWAGGSAGGTDQLLVGELARTIGADPKRTKYIAHSGGGEANTAILSGAVDVGVSGISEFTAQVEAGKMRLLAVSSPSNVTVDGKRPRTLRQQGIDLELTNWRGIVAPPGISAEQRAKVTAYVRRVLGTPAWRANLKRFDWAPFVRTGPQLDRFFATEGARVHQVVSDLGLGE